MGLPMSAIYCFCTQSLLKLIVNLRSDIGFKEEDVNDVFNANYLHQRPPPYLVSGQTISNRS
jgi:hypothetical protein